MAYRIAAFADAHSDYSYGSRTDEQGVNLRARDGYNALGAVVNDIIAHKDQIDSVVVAGDMFHTSHPSVRGIVVWQHYLRELAKAGLPVDTLAGNHDVTDDRSMPSAVAIVDDRDRNIRAHHKPYVTQPLADGVFLHLVSHHGLSGDQTPELKPIDGAINIFSTHGAAVDPGNHALMRCMDSPREQVIPPEIVMSDDYALRILGHYHSRSFVGNRSLNTWYTGSLLRRGFSDTAGSRGWTLFTIHDNGEIEVEHHDIFQRPQIDLPVIDGANMSADDIQDNIILHLEGTRERERGAEFDNERAPILRQRVINVPPAVRAGLDRARISQESAHSLKWLLEISRPEAVEIAQLVGGEVEETEGGILVPSMSRQGGRLNLVRAYDQWADSSRTLGELSESRRKPVKEEAQDHLQHAQDIAVTDV